MTETKTMDDIHKKMLKRFHTLCTVLGMTTGDKEALLRAYGVESSRDLDTHDLIDIVASLSKDAEQMQNAQRAELDKMRKRCIASIGKWLNATGQKNDIKVIKAIACRATQYEAFNKIPKERLRNITFLFNNKVKDLSEPEDAGNVVPLHSNS